MVTAMTDFKISLKSRLDPNLIAFMHFLVASSFLMGSWVNDTVQSAVARPVQSVQPAA